MVHTLVRMAEGAAVEDHPGVPPWVFGAVALVVLLLLLFVVTRFNPDR
jgi:MYXO-CTERM domain-containing protein